MATNIWAITDTFTLLSTIERIEQPESFLADRFFGDTLTVNTSYVAVEYRAEGRLLAPMLVKNARGVDVNRGTSKISYYAPLLFGPRRVISLANLETRMFGETPNLYSPTPPEARAAKLQSDDLAELIRLHANRREQLAAELLQTGKIHIKAYADDNKVEETDEINFNWDGEVIPTKDWNDSDATIYDDLFAVSERIQRRVGEIPTYAICGKGVEQDLLKNPEIKAWLMTPNPSNLMMANFAPEWTSPQTRYIGRISALNMDFVSYAKTYIDEDGKTKPYIADNTVIIACGNIGRTIYAPVPIFENGQWNTIAAPQVPKYTVDNEAQTTALTLYSRYVLVPNATDFWATIKTHGNS